MILTIAHSKGGSKKSTTCWHLANGLRKRYPDKNVFIIDIDTQQTITIVNNIRKQKAKLDEFVIYQPKNISSLLSILELHKDDIVLIDTGGFDKDINRVAIKKADMVLVPLMASIHDVLGFRMFRAILKDIGVAKVNILITMVHHRQKNFDEISEALASFEEAKLLDSRIPNNSANYKTMALGLSIYDIDANLCKHYEGIIDELFFN